MMISTKGRYGLRVMLDLCQQNKGEYISLKSISMRQDISMKYLEAIVAALTRDGLLKSQRGKDGGYMLLREPEEYTVGEILRATEGRLTTVACTDCEDGIESCQRAEGCLTQPIWRKLDIIINGCLDDISLADVLEGRVSL